MSTQESSLRVALNRIEWRSLLKSLSERKKAFYFRQPVDPIALNIPHYCTVIPRPMDLGTISARLDAGEYPTVETFSEDVRLVFTNAMTFNKDPNHQALKAVSIA